MPAPIVKFEAIRPKKLPVYDTKLFTKYMQMAMDDTATVMLKDFKSITREWDEKPVFKVYKSSFSVGSRDVSIRIGTTDYIFTILNNGVVPHDITIRYAKWMYFLSSYNAKTTPNRISSKHGGPRGQGRYAKHVSHPGVEARNFDQVIAKLHNRERTLQTNIDKRWIQLVRVANGGG